MHSPRTSWEGGPAAAILQELCKGARERDGTAVWQAGSPRQPSSGVRGWEPGPATEPWFLSVTWMSAGNAGWHTASAQDAGGALKIAQPQDWLPHSPRTVCAQQRPSVLSHHLPLGAWVSLRGTLGCRHACQDPDGQGRGQEGTSPRPMARGPATSLSPDGSCPPTPLPSPWGSGWLTSSPSPQTPFLFLLLEQSF